MKPLDEALREIRRLVEETGADHAAIYVRADGQVSINGMTYAGLSLWWGWADVSTEKSGVASLREPSALIELVKARSSELGAGRPKEK